MEQFQQIGEVVGSLKAMMVFQEEIQINQRQCCLLLDMFSFAYETIAEEMKQNPSSEQRLRRISHPQFAKLHSGCH